jgi:hypothetical protein
MEFWLENLKERDPWVALICINEGELDFMQSRDSGGLLCI